MFLLLLLLLIPLKVSAQHYSVYYTVITKTEADTTILYPKIKSWDVHVISRYKTAFVLGTNNPYHDGFLVLDSLKAIVDSNGISPILYAEYDKSVKLNGNDSTRLSNMWGKDSLRVTGAYELGDSGQNVILGVLDTGLDDTHQEFTGRFLGGIAFSNSGIDSSQYSWRPTNLNCRYHGTHVTGIAAGKTVGVAPGVKILFAKVFDPSGDCVAWMGPIIQGFYWLRDHGAQVTNASISGSFYGAYEAALWSSPQTIMVAAAGNNGTYVNFPASSQYAIGAAAIASNLSHASYSNVGPQNDFATPGSNIYSALPNDRYGTKSGTSMASPALEGLVALYISARGHSVPIDTVYDALKFASLDLGPIGHDSLYGWGMPRADRLVAKGLGLNENPLVLTDPIQVTNGSTGCVNVSSTVLWGVDYATKPSWLTVNVFKDRLCYSITNVPNGVTDTLKLEVIK